MSEGWVALDYFNGAIMGPPWNLLPKDQSGSLPQGVWETKKWDKSYVYDLVYT